MSAKAKAAFAAALVLVTVFVYAQTARHSFLTWDDYAYVVDNENVRSGFTTNGLRAAFTTTLHGNWHPLTVLSHMADVELWGLSPGAHHLVNVAIHCFNAIGLFLLLTYLTRAAWQSGFVAALFALHPINVETVAWIAERKNLLSFSFGLLAIASYAAWTARRSLGRYLLFLGMFALSLMCKANLIVLPALLLALDIWPLQRIDVGGSLFDAIRQTSRRIPEKVPALALSIVIGVMTLVAQRSAGATGGTDEFPVPSRLANAVVSTVWYLAKAIWPSSLNSLYLHPSIGGSAQSPVTIIVCGSIIAAITWVTWRARVRMPPLFSGWMWFLIALLPVIGLIQAGYQSHADRYAYVPLIGVFIAAAFSMKTLTVARFAAMVCILCSLALVTWRLAGNWRDDETLYLRAVAIDPRNWVMLNNLSAVYVERGASAEAASAARQALRVRPSHAPAWANLGIALVQKGDYGSAIETLRRAAELDPSNELVWRNLAAAHTETGNFRSAIGAAAMALRLNPNDPFAFYWIAVSQSALGNETAAGAAAARVQQIAPAIARELGIE